jgi:hypothetical protein
MMTAKIGKSPKVNWDAQKAKLKLTFPKLTAADLNFDETQKTEMLMKLELKLAMSSEEIRFIIESL